MVKTGVGEAPPPPQDKNTLLLHNKGSRTVRRAELVDDLSRREDERDHDL